MLKFSLRSFLMIFSVAIANFAFATSPRYLELADSADYFIARERWDLAEKTIIEALRLEPANFTNALLLANLGLVQANKGELEKSRESLSVGLNLSPSSTVLLNNRAHTFLLMDSISLAKVDLNRSLQIDSIQEWTLQTRGFLYIREGQLEDAERIFRQLEHHFPDNLKIYAAKAEIAQRAGDTDKAISLYGQALEINPEDLESREAYIYLLIKNGNYDLARKQIRVGLEINTENPMFYLLRGYLHRLNFRLDESEADKKIAISKGMDPAFVEEWFTR